MAKKQKEPDKGPSNAYLLSFGDTMTTLLAFFIVLNSLAEEQTGANLYTGTGSFIRVMNSLGLPGALSGDTTKNPIAKSETNPLYMAPDDDNNPPDANGSGPDANDDGLRVIDREQDEFDRFMNEMERLANVEKKPDTEGEAVFDFFNKLNPQAPYLSPAYQGAMSQVLPLLRREGYQVEVIVWATTPSPTAWTRATEQARSIGTDLGNMARIPAGKRSRIATVGRPWIDSVAKRPVMTIVCRRRSSD
ncbi:MAG: flagellar motor protein MotB [Pirellulaceae bacterium]|nr:hypothetical protein [Planctomycetales bacterium]